MGLHTLGIKTDDKKYYFAFRSIVFRWKLENRVYVCRKVYAYFGLTLRRNNGANYSKLHKA